MPRPITNGWIKVGAKFISCDGECYKRTCDKGGNERIAVKGEGLS